jgi:hypothetical protein
MQPGYKSPSTFLAEVSKRIGWGKDTGRGYILHPQVAGITIAVDDWKRIRRVHAYSTSWKALDHITAIQNIKHGFKDVEFVDRHGPRGNRRYVGWQWSRQTGGTFAEEVEKAYNLAKLLEPFVEGAS